jgi:transcriptional regulator with XRE-family HTH domain
MPANNRNGLTARGFREAMIGAAFRAAREKQKIPLRTLAPAIGVSINTIRWHEAGARLLRTETVDKAAQFMNVPVSHLFEQPPEDPAPEATAKRKRKRKPKA